MTFITRRLNNPEGAALTWQAPGSLGLQVWIGMLAGNPVARISRQPSHGKGCSAVLDGWMWAEHLAGSGADKLGVKESPTRGFLSVPEAKRSEQSRRPWPPEPEGKQQPMDVSQHLQAHAESAVRETRWFRTAHDAVKPSLKVEVLGVEVRSGSSLMGGMVSGPCLVADATCGEETRRFCWAFRLGDTHEIDC